MIYQHNYVYLKISDIYDRNLHCFTTRGLKLLKCTETYGVGLLEPGLVPGDEVGQVEEHVQVVWGYPRRVTLTYKDKQNIAIRCTMPRECYFFAIKLFSSNFKL